MRIILAVERQTSHMSLPRGAAMLRSSKCTLTFESKGEGALGGPPLDSELKWRGEPREKSQGKEQTQTHGQREQEKHQNKAGESNIQRGESCSVSSLRVRSCRCGSTGVGPLHQPQLSAAVVCNKDMQEGRHVESRLHDARAAASRRHKHMPSQRSDESEVLSGAAGRVEKPRCTSRRVLSLLRTRRDTEYPAAEGRDARERRRRGARRLRAIRAVSPSTSTVGGAAV